MRHKVAGRQLSRSPSHRKAMIRNMVTSLVIHERIETTLAKAKVIRRIAERMITLGKRGTLHARRQMLKTIRTSQAAAKVIDELAKRFETRQGGYTRIYRTWHRAGDAAAMSIIEFLPAEKIEQPKEAKVEKSKKEAKKKTKAADVKKKDSPKKDTSKKSSAKKDSGKKETEKKDSDKKSSKKKASGKKAKSS